MPPFILFIRDDGSRGSPRRGWRVEPGVVFENGNGARRNVVAEPGHSELPPTASSARFKRPDNRQKRHHLIYCHVLKSKITPQIRALGRPRRSKSRRVGAVSEKSGRSCSEVAIWPVSNRPRQPWPTKASVPSPTGAIRPRGGSVRCQRLLRPRPQRPPRLSCSPG
jgi:hypothetical protein